MPDSDPYSRTIYNVKSFSDCVELCNYDPCQFATYDYVEEKCTVRNATMPKLLG